MLQKPLKLRDSEDYPFSEADILENISEAIIILDADWAIIYMNSHAEKISRKKRQKTIGKNFFHIFPEIKDPTYKKFFRKVLKTRQTDTIEGFYEPQDMWLTIKIFPVQSGGVGVAFQENTLRKRIEVIAASQSEALSLALKGASLEEVLNVLVLAVEKQTGHKATASILLLSDDGKHLLHGAAPNLSNSYCEAIDGMEIGENIGSCGTAVHRDEFVIAEDISIDIKWNNFRELALKNNLASCWSMPIFSTQNKSVLGTFAVYYPEVRSPAETDKHIVEVLSQTAAILIEREKENKARMLAEEAVNLSTKKFSKQRRLYETLLSNTPDLVYIFDLEGRFTYVNKALLKMWRRTWEDSVGKTCFELGYEPWHAEMHMREIEQVIKTKKPIRGDVPFTGMHGRRIYDYIFMPVLGEDGEVEAIAGTTRDVTERRKAEEAAQKSEERQRLALEASHSFGIWDWDIKNDVFTADERFGALFNLSPEEAKEGVKLEQVAQYIHENDFKRVLDVIKEKLQTGGHYKEEYRVRQKDGTIKWVSVRGNIQLDENGEAVRFPGVGVDITLERNAIEALREADQKKDEFLATLTHELRNPLAPMRNALYVIKSNSANAEAQTHAHELIERQISQIVRLIDDLMDVSRITRGKIRISKDIVDIQKAITDAVETVQPLIEERNHELILNFPDNPVFVEGDLVRLAQIFSNLINNAAKYTEQKGEIEVNIRQFGRVVEIEIIDNGIGIAKEKLPFIFDMFSQFEDPLNRSQGVLGIGLTLVEKLVELHGGSVDVESKGINEGTKFTVSLPVSVAQNADTPDSLCKVPNFTQQKIKVLVVDDNKDAAQTMGWLMEALGCEAQTAFDGKSAIKLALSYLPDLVLLDIGLPEMNGYEVCETMKKIPELKNTVFAAQTGWGQPEHKKRSKEAGFDHHLVKPVEMAALEAILNKINL
ncbi:PAS domain S-box protein [Nitrosococcus oceani]|uniref:PAS domain S-box protein n=1 Tax=Nitrosococcus oceani TaxID=1229 RepID=UPI0004E864DD|nr:PAS domain S-box protein [Nitrosococcus oceani]KFI22885.1 ATPase [Nitrosococcus oceani]